MFATFFSQIKSIVNPSEFDKILNEEISNEEKIPRLINAIKEYEDYDKIEKLIDNSKISDDEKINLNLKASVKIAFEKYEKSKEPYGEENTEKNRNFFNKIDNFIKANHKNKKNIIAESIAKLVLENNFSPNEEHFNFFNGIKAYINFHDELYKGFFSALNDSQNGFTLSKDNADKMKGFLSNLPNHSFLLIILYMFVRSKLNNEEHKSSYKVLKLLDTLDFFKKNDTAAQEIKETFLFYFFIQTKQDENFNNYLENFMKSKKGSAFVEHPAYQLISEKLMLDSAKDNPEKLNVKVTRTPENQITINLGLTAGSIANFLWPTHFNKEEITVKDQISGLDWQFIFSKSQEFDETLLAKNQSAEQQQFTETSTTTTTTSSVEENVSSGMRP